MVTEVTPDGQIVVLSLPEPLPGWLWAQCLENRLYVAWTEDDGYVIDLDDLCTLLAAAGLCRSGHRPH